MPQSQNPPAGDVDVDVGSGGREVPERERAVLVQQNSVTRTVSVMMPVTLLAALNEADLERTVRVLLELTQASWAEVDVAVGILVDRHDVSDRTRATAARCCGARTAR